MCGMVLCIWIQTWKWKEQLILSTEKDFQSSYSIVLKPVPLISQNVMRNPEIFISELNSVPALLWNNKLIFQGQVFISHVFEIKSLLHKEY